MMYDGKSSVFNDSIWVTNFGLQTVDTLMRGIDLYSYTWIIELDIGGLFLNLIISEEAQQLVGLDITPFLEEELDDKERVNTIW